MNCLDLSCIRNSEHVVFISYKVDPIYDEDEEYIDKHNADDEMMLTLSSVA